MLTSLERQSLIDHAAKIRTELDDESISILTDQISKSEFIQNRIDAIGVRGRQRSLNHVVKLQRYCNYTERGQTEACGRPISAHRVMCLAHITMFAAELCICGSSRMEHMSPGIPCRKFVSIWTKELPLFDPVPHIYPDEFDESYQASAK